MAWKIACAVLVVLVLAVSYGWMSGIDGFNKTHLGYIGEDEKFSLNLSGLSDEERDRLDKRARGEENLAVCCVLVLFAMGGFIGGLALGQNRN